MPETIGASRPASVMIPGLPLVKAAEARNAAKPKATTLDLSAVDLTGGVPSFPVEYPEGADVGYRWYQRQGATPAYAFGHGLSYTRFAYRDLKVGGGAVSFSVTNTGRRAGADVPQVYAAPAGQMRRLVGFRRVMLQPGETKQVSVTIDPRLMARYDTARPGWSVAAGAVSITVGRQAGDAALSGTMQMSAQAMKP